MTNLETTILALFNTYETAEGTKSDLGVSWTDAADLAKASGLPVNVVKGILGSLVKKDLVQVDVGGHNNPVVCLTDAGADARHAIPADFEPSKFDAEQAMIEALAEAAIEEAEQIALGKPFPGIICATLRSHAFGWTGTRKSFIAAVTSVGYNKATAATQWQRARGK